MDELRRQNDLHALSSPKFPITIDGKIVQVVEGESLLGVLTAVGFHQISLNDHRCGIGAYCAMGVCHCCLVRVNGAYKRRACQTTVAPDMRVETNANRMNDMGLK